MATLSEAEREELDELLASFGVVHVPRYTGTLRQFVRETDPRYVLYRHVEAAIDHLEALVSGELLRLMMFEPPRHGKSELVSRKLPAYFLAKYPELWAGIVSYEAGMAEGFSRNARDHYQRVGGDLRGDSSAVNLWQTLYGGGLWAAGMGGPITGKGMHLGVIDDPIKNAEEAASETIRAKHQDWYRSTFYTRMEPGSRLLVTQTRWHEDDLSGWLLAQEAEAPESWTVVNLPAIAEGAGRVWPATCQVVPDWRTAGEALCPERYDLTALAGIQRRVGSYWWGSLYQQRPAPLEGGLFKRSWWQTYDEAPETFDRVCTSWDMAFKDTDGSDFVVGQVWGMRGPDLYLLDQVRARMDYPTSEKAVVALRKRHPLAFATYIEDKANGPAVIASLQRNKLLGGVVAVEPQGGKLARASGVSPLVEAGNVYLPAPHLAPWVGEFIDECAAFPNGTHDDQVDAMTQALHQLAPFTLASPPPTPTPRRPDIGRSLRQIVPPVPPPVGPHIGRRVAPRRSA